MHSSTGRQNGGLFWLVGVLCYFERWLHSYCTKRWVHSSLHRIADAEWEGREENIFTVTIAAAAGPPGVSHIPFSMCQQKRIFRAVLAVCDQGNRKQLTHHAASLLLASNIATFRHMAYVSHITECVESHLNSKLCYKYIQFYFCLPS